jgi:hypothetical protein
MHQEHTNSKLTQPKCRVYLNKNPQEHPFPTSKIMGDVWRETRRRAATKLERFKPILSDLGIDAQKTTRAPPTNRKHNKQRQNNRWRAEDLLACAKMNARAFLTAC